MDNLKILLLITALLLSLIYLLKRYKKGRKTFAATAPPNLGLQAVPFFEQLLGFLAQINAQARKTGGSVLAGSILSKGAEQGTYMLAEDGGWLTYVGISSYFSLDEGDNARNIAGEQLLFFSLNQFFPNKQEARSFFDHLSAPVLNLQEQENVIETKNLRFRCACDWNYSATPPEEIPAALQHIKRPVVFSLEVTPLKIGA